MTKKIEWMIKQQCKLTLDRPHANKWTGSLECRDGRACWGGEFKGKSFNGIIDKMYLFVKKDKDKRKRYKQTQGGQ